MVKVREIYKRLRSNNKYVIVYDVYNYNVYYIPLRGVPPETSLYLDVRKANVMNITEFEEKFKLEPDLKF